MCLEFSAFLRFLDETRFLAGFLVGNIVSIAGVSNVFQMCFLRACVLMLILCVIRHFHLLRNQRSVFARSVDFFLWVGGGGGGAVVGIF